MLTTKPTSMCKDSESMAVLPARVSTIKCWNISNEWHLSKLDLLRSENLIRPHAELRSLVSIHSSPLHSVGVLVVLPWHWGTEKWKFTFKVLGFWSWKVWTGLMICIQTEIRLEVWAPAIWVFFHGSALASPFSILPSLSLPQKEHWNLSPQSSQIMAGHMKAPHHPHPFMHCGSMHTCRGF